MSFEQYTEYDRSIFWNEEICGDISHNPPFHLIVRPGLYEHRCSTCGKRTILRSAPTRYGTNQLEIVDHRWIDDD